MYEPPSSWPSPVKSVPVLLLLHLILGIVFALCVVIAPVIVVATRRNSLRDDINTPRTWSALFASFLALLVIALAVTDAAVWGKAKGENEDFHPDILGYL